MLALACILETGGDSVSSRRAARAQGLLSISLLLERIMAVRKSPEAREFLSLHRVQGCVDPFHTRYARSARAGTRFSKLKVAPFLHCSVTPRRPHEAFPGPGSSVAVGRSQPPPALQHGHSSHTPLTAAFTPDAHCNHCSPRAQTLCESTMSAPHHSSASGAEAASAAQRAAVRRTQWRCASAGHRKSLLGAATTGSIAAEATRRHDPRELLRWG